MDVALWLWGNLPSWSQLMCVGRSHAKHNQYQNDDKQWFCYGFITVEYMMMYRSLNVASSLASRHLLQLDHACLVIDHGIMFDGVFIFFYFFGHSASRLSHGKIRDHYVFFDRVFFHFFNRPLIFNLLDLPNQCCILLIIDIETKRKKKNLERHEQTY